MLNHTTHKASKVSAPVARAPRVSLTLRSFTLQRAGVSNFVVSGSNHCGPVNALINVPGNRKAIPVRWNVTVECEPKLDDRGFLFDQASVGMWMDRVAEQGTTLSCEMLARNVAERLLAKIERDVPTCKVKSLKLEFSPAPYAASLTVLYA